MSDSTRSLTIRAALAACLLLFAAVRAAAQIPQPVVAPAPPEPAFLPRYEFHMTTYKFTIDDPQQRFDWDAHFGGSVDLVDYVVGRAALAVDYETVLGNEQRPFDPNQDAYTLEGSVSARAGGAEIVAVFHHLSRHLTDRPKLFAVAWNTMGGRLLYQGRAADTTIDIDLDIGKVIQHSFVDYTWIRQLGVQVRHPVTSRAGVFFRGNGQLFATDDKLTDRGRQPGGFAEAGLRVEGAAGALEIFAGVERRVDAYPTERTARQWGLAGFRLISR
jgi:hypothetical protein